MNETIRRAGLISAIAARAGLDRDQAAAALDAFTITVKAALAAGDDVQVRNFGRFSVYRAEATTAANPRTGALVAVPAKQRIRFRPSGRLREAVRGR